MKFRTIFSLLILFFCVFIVISISKNEKKEIERENKKIEKEKKEESEKKYLRITCYSCQGKKRIYDPVNKSQKRCFTCSGTGGRTVPKLRDGQSVCPSCQGMGKILTTSQYNQPTGYRKCSLCRSRGIITQ